MAYTEETGSEEAESEEAVPESGAPKKGKKTKKKNVKPPPPKDAQWWRAEELGLKPHEILDTLAKQIEDDQDGRREAYREYERMFTGGDLHGDVIALIAAGELSQNELANTIETLWAQVFKNRIVPAVCTNEADWDEWDRAKAYSRWLEGALDQAEAYETAIPMAGLYSLVYGTGPIRVSWKESWDDEKAASITVTAVNPKYLTVDRLEAKHGVPRSLYYKTHIDRTVLHDTYKEDNSDFCGTPAYRVAGIEAVGANDDEELGIGPSKKCDMVTVREAWHLPSGPGAKDGRHVIWIKNCTLLDEEYTWETFPFVFMRFGSRLEGFWGESAVKRLGPTQKLLDKLNRKIDESQNVMGVPRILVRNAANIKVAHIDDVPGGILQCDDINGIKEWNAECVTPELYADRDNAPRKMRSLLGVSDFEVQQQIPQGMRDVSGAFLERWVDQGQARHAMFHRDYENAVVALSYLVMCQAKECQDMGYEMVVASQGYDHNKTSMEMLSFKDVYVDRKKLKLRVQPMSDLPQTFAGKVEAIAKLRNDAGVQVDPKTVMRMLQVPDVGQVTDMLVSDEEIIMKNLTHMCKTGEYVSPLPFDNLDLIIQMTTRYINNYRLKENADMKKVGLLAQYIDQAIALKKGLGGSDPNAPPPMSTMAALSGMGPQPLGPPMPGPGMAPMGPPPGPGMGPVPPPPGPGMPGMPQPPMPPVL